MAKAASILNIPVYITTQNAARLGATVAELTALIPSAAASTVDKTAFSMLVPEVESRLRAQQQQHAAAAASASSSSSSEDKSKLAPVDVLLVGIETHICVTQTALDLLALGHRVYVLADGVSSCNAGERTVALARLARDGCTVTTSESVLFELVGDAASSSFKAISALVKDSKDDTRLAVETFCGGPGAAGWKL